MALAAAVLLLPAFIHAALLHPALDRYTAVEELFALPPSEDTARAPSDDGLGDCTPGELVWVNCNLCTCNRLGKPNEVCARMWCQPQPTRPPYSINYNYNDI